MNDSGQKPSQKLGQESTNFTASMKLIPKLILRNGVRFSTRLHPPRQRASNEPLHKNQKMIGRGLFHAEKSFSMESRIKLIWT